MSRNKKLVRAVERGNKRIISELLEWWLGRLIWNPRGISEHPAMASEIPNTPATIASDMSRGGFDKEDIENVLAQCFSRAARKLWKKVRFFDKEVCVSMRILIVEDLPENVEAAKKALEKTHSLDIVKSYEEAKALLDENIYSAAILDLNFPKQEGGEPEKLGFMLEIQCFARNIPCVVLSATTHSGGNLGPVVSRIYKKEESIELTKSVFDTIDLPKKCHPDSWKMAFKYLRMIAPNMEEVARAKKRRRMFVG